MNFNCEAVTDAPLEGELLLDEEGESIVRVGIGSHVSFDLSYKQGAFYIELVEGSNIKILKEPGWEKDLSLNHSEIVEEGEIKEMTVRCDWKENK